MTTNNSTESYFFKLLPNHFRVEYAFAKNIKPNTTYRLALFKGIIKMDEMSHALKVRLVGGKIMLNDIRLSFYLPVFSPVRNVEFTVKLMSAVGNEVESELASHRIKSGEYIKRFRGDGTCRFHEEIQLLGSFYLVYDLFLHHSSKQLEQLVKLQGQKTRHAPFNHSLYNHNQNVYQKETNSQYFSQYEESETGSVKRQDSVYSVKRKLTRKRGHDGILKKVEHLKSKEDSSRKSSQLSEKKERMGLTIRQQNQLFYVPLKHVQSRKRSQSDRYMLKSFNHEQEVSEPKKELLTPQRSTPKFKQFLENKESIMNCIKVQTVDSLYPQSKEVFVNYHSLQSFKKQPINEMQNHKQTYSKDLLEKQANVWHKQSFGKLGGFKTAETNALAIDLQQNHQGQRRNPASRYNSSQLSSEQAGESNRQDLLQSGKQTKLVKRIFSLPQNPIKLSYRSPSEYDAGEDLAPRQYQSIKKKIFYALFWIISFLLLLNGLLPSRKK